MHNQSKGVFLCGKSDSICAYSIGFCLRSKTLTQSLQCAHISRLFYLSYLMCDKFILDASCGSRMFWFDRLHENTIYADVRNEEHVLCDGRDLKINPDVQMDFRYMPFESESFKLIVWDPPHLIKLGKNSWMAKKYGRLNETWQEDLRAGFKECYRVLEDKGVLIFKWNERDIKIKEILALSNQKPLFGHTTRKNGETIWIVFMKL